MYGDNIDQIAATLIRSLGGDFASGTCRCPAHNDKRASLSVQVVNGKLLVHCFAGCSQDAVISALKSRNLWPAKTGYNPTEAPEYESQQFKEYMRRRKAYAILRTAALNDDLSGLKKYLAGRGIHVVPPNAMFLTAAQSRKLTGKGFPAMVLPVISEKEGLVGCQITYLTRDCSQKLKSKTSRKSFGTIKGGYVQIGERPERIEQIIVGEGIESVLSVSQATGFMGAAALSASNMKSVALPYCQEVTIAVDHDKAGLKAADELKSKLLLEGYIVRYAVPKKPGRDWNDELKAANDDQEVAQRILSAKPIKPKVNNRALNIDEYLSLDFPTRDKLLSPWLMTSSIGMMYAKPGSSKTFLVLSVAQAVATGDSLMDWKCDRPANVLFVDGELPGYDLQQRLKLIQPRPKEGRLMIVSAADLYLRELDAPDIGTEAGRKFLNKIIERHEIELIILDSLTTLRRSGEENTSEDWRSIQSWMLSHRQAGRTIIFLHHENKSGSSRGTSAMEVVLDFSIRLERLPDDCTDEYSASKLSWTKVRSIWGEDASDRKIKMSTVNGLIEWEFEAIDSKSDENLEKVVELIKAGKKQIEIAKELELSKGRISQLVSKARERGLV